MALKTGEDVPSGEGGLTLNGIKAEAA